MNLLFDLDGTLADPFAAFSSSLAFAYNKHQLPLPTPHELRLCIGPPLQISLREILGLSEQMAQEVLKDYRLHHGSKGIFEYQFFPQIPSVLATLAPSHRLFVATSKPWPYAHTIFQHFQLASWFEYIYGSEMDGTRSNKAQLLDFILHKEKLAANETIMIGDREHDILAAKKNGLQSIGVLWGFGPREELAAAGADLIFEDFEQLCLIPKRGGLLPLQNS